MAGRPENDDGIGDRGWQVKRTPIAGYVILIEHDGMFRTGSLVDGEIYATFSGHDGTLFRSRAAANAAIKATLQSTNENLLLKKRRYFVARLRKQESNKRVKASKS